MGMNKENVNIIEYYSGIKRGKSCHLWQHGWTTYEISQTEKDKCHGVSFIYGIKKQKQAPRQRERDWWLPEELGDGQNGWRELKANF